MTCKSLSSKLYATGLIFAASILLIAVKSQADIVKGPYVQNVRTDEATICWESDNPARGSVAFTKVLEDGSAGRKRVIDFVEPAAFKEVRLPILSAGTTYRYRVEDESGGIELGEFQTAPGRLVPFRFAAYGDCRSNHNMHRKIIKLMMEYDPKLVLNTGDLVNRGSKQHDWDMFWPVVDRLVRNVPYYPSLGNHEQDSPLYYKYFSLPTGADGERYYAFAYSNVLFIALDSNAPHMLLAEQKNWLKKVLKHTQQFDFHIVFFHHPLYSSSKRDPNLHYRKIYVPIFKRYGVDAVLNGHDHFYERCVDENGIQYIVTGGGGAGLYEQVRTLPQSVVKKRTHNFMIFDVDGPRMRAKTLDDKGRIIDEIAFSAD